MKGRLSPCIIGSVSTIFAYFEDFGGKSPAMSLCLQNGIICKRLKFQRFYDLHISFIEVRPSEKSKKLHHFSIFMRNWWSLMPTLS